MNTAPVIYGRAITRKIAASFLAREPKRDGATHTDGTTLFLHGNAIAQWRAGELWFTLAGWNTATTRERLKGIGVRVSNRAGVPHYNGKPISATAWQKEEPASEGGAA